MELSPERLISEVEKGKCLPVYLFQGPDEFRKEKLISKLKELFLPESSRDFNFQIFYADETVITEIIDSAKSVPFLADRRLIVVRRSESFKKKDLELVAPYFSDPCPTTCIIFVSSKGEPKRLATMIKKRGGVVNFLSLREGQIVSWLKQTAGEMGMRIKGEACAFLHEIVGSSLMELHNEMEKLALRYPDTEIGIKEIKELCIHSREYTIFELVDSLGYKRADKALSILGPFLQEGDRDTALGVLGMLTRQIRLMWKAVTLSGKGESVSRIASQLGIREFLVKKLLDQSRQWTHEEFIKFLDDLYRADGLIKTGAPARLILESLIFCFAGQDRS